MERFDSREGLPTYATGQGFPLKAYVGGREGLKETLRQQRLAPTSVGLVSRVRGKSALWSTKTQDTLWSTGGHMPLMVFVGE